MDLQENGTRKKIVGVAVGLAIVFGVWSLVGALGVVNGYVLPSPGRVLRAFRKMAGSGELVRDVGISFARVLKGFAIATLLAFLLGSVSYFAPKAAPYYALFVTFFRNVPPLAMIPLLILWCGIGETTKTVIIVMATFFPIYLGVVKGLTGTDPKLLEVGKVFGLSVRQRFFRIVLPYAVPDLLVGMRTGMGYAWRSIIGAEMIAASTGLGHLILFSQQTSRTDKVIVGIFVIGIVGCLTDLLFGLLIRILLKGVAGNGWN